MVERLSISHQIHLIHTLERELECSHHNAVWINPYVLNVVDVHSWISVYEMLDWWLPKWPMYYWTWNWSRSMTCHRKLISWRLIHCIWRTQVQSILSRKQTMVFLIILYLINTQWECSYQRFLKTSLDSIMKETILCLWEYSQSSSMITMIKRLNQICWQFLHWQDSMYSILYRKMQNIT